MTSTPVVYCPSAEKGQWVETAWLVQKSAHWGIVQIQYQPDLLPMVRR